MNQLSRKRIEMIINKTTSGSALTIYMPTHQIPTPEHVKEDKIRFKNSMNKAFDLIKENDEEYFLSFLQTKYKELLENKSFWEQCTKSLLITARLGMFEVTHLPVDTDEYVALDDHFHLGPVYGLLHDMQQFYLLNIAQHGPVLYEGDNYELRESELELPASIEEAMNLDEEHLKSVQHHAAGNSGAMYSNNTAQYHGHGGGKDTGDWENEQFMRIIDKAVSEYVDNSLPIVLAGPQREVTRFRKITSLNNVLDTTYKTSGNNLKLNEAHEEVFEIIQREIIDTRKQKILQSFKRALARTPGKTVSNANDLQRVAMEGRADTVLLTVWKKTTDTVRDNTEQVRKLVLPMYKQTKDIDSTLQQAWLQGAKIINVLSSQAPTKSFVAANLRY